jgi:hypothetical protein
MTEEDLKKIPFGLLSVNGYAFVQTTSERRHLAK